MGKTVKVCAAQYELSPIKGWDCLVERVTYFAQVASTYGCHYLLYPEYFTVQLLGTIGVEDASPHEQIAALAGFTSRYIELFTGLAARYELYIIGGTQPVQREDGIYNVAHLFSPHSSRVFTQDKLHITPFEREVWDIKAGSTVKVFETPELTFGVPICYDIEFPELSRILVDHGAQALFVPFSTDDRPAYHRVATTAAARSVENYVYTIIAGNDGHLMGVTDYLLNYSRSAIFTPSDTVFPRDATLGQSEHSGMDAVMAELDLELLSRSRSVDPRRDRQRALYTTQVHTDVERVLFT